MLSDQVRRRDWVIGVVATALILAGMVWAKSGQVEPQQESAAVSFDLAAATDPGLSESALR